MAGRAIAIYARVREAFGRGEEVVVATVVDASGCSPDVAAATLGAKLLLDRGGGLLFHSFGGEVPGLGELAREVAGCVADRMEEIVAVRSPKLARVTVATAGGAELEIFLDPLVRQPEIIVVGGGHIGKAVCTLGSLVGFDVTVVDDRPAFADPRRFPEARRTLCGDYAAVLAEVEITPLSYVVIVTRGHRYDVASLEHVLDKPAAYIGMIGSHRRVAGIMEYLRGKGVGEDVLARIHAPIGLDIGARTPEEIGVSIVAELVKQRRGGTGVSLRDAPKGR